MAEIQAKMVRTLSPAGVSIGYQAYCGDSHWPQACTITLIKKMLDRGVLVYEQLAEEAKDGSTEVLLTIDNYDQDNGGAEIPEGTNIIPDIELEVEERHAVEREEWLKEKGQEIKAKQTTISNKFLGITEEDSDNEQSTDETISQDDDDVESD